jgi:hypothetical protein
LPIFAGTESRYLHNGGTYVPGPGPEPANEPSPVSGYECDGAGEGSALA